MGTFDHARWHREETSLEKAGTHIAMFLGWAITRDLVSMARLEDPSSAWYIGRIRSRERTPRDFLVDLCHNRLTETDLTDEGAGFAATYYSRYLADYRRTFPEVASIYDVEDTWENLDRIAAILDRRLAQFRRWRAKHGNDAQPPPLVSRALRSAQGTSPPHGSARVRVDREPPPAPSAPRPIEPAPAPPTAWRRDDTPPG